MTSILFIYALINVGLSVLVSESVIQEQHCTTLMLNLYKMGNTAVVKVPTTAGALEYCENNKHIMRHAKENNQ